MYSIILNIIAMILIISSLVFLSWLLRWKIVKNISIFSSIYVLALSDIFSDIILAIILLLNRYNIISDDQPEGKNIIDDLYTNKVIMTSNNCNFASVVLHYSMFIVPLTNSFISLVGKLFHCNYYIKRIGVKCDQFIVHSSDSTNIKRSTSLLTLPLSSSLRKKKLTITISSVMSQWIIPVLLIVSMYAFGHNSFDIPSQLDNSMCIYTVNAPLNHCYEKKNANIITTYIDNDDNNDNDTLSFEKHDCINNYESLGLCTENSSLSTSLVDKIILNIRNIVELFQNKSNLITNESSIYSESKLTAKTILMEQSNSTFDSEFSVINESNDVLIKDPSLSYVKNINISNNILNSTVYFHKNESTIENTIPLCLNNWCFMSPSVLKIHFIISSFIAYFGTICVLIISHLQCKYIYSNIDEKLKSTINRNIVTKVNISPVPLLNIKPNNEYIAGTHDNNQRTKTKIHMNENLFANIKEEANNVKELAVILRMTIFFAVSLWTPVLLDIIIKVLLCYQIPDWFTNIFYTIAMSFEIIRNISNINTIKNTQILPNNWIKYNSISPISVTPSED